MADPKGLDRVIAQRRILITCGTGGVGKTTVSAAVGLRAALAGRRTVVVTIDPAKRLATSLGVENLGDTPADLTERLRAAVSPATTAGGRVDGSFHAVTPDTRSTLRAYFEGLAPSPEVAERITRNPIFQILARDYSGANEYMALQKLLGLHRSGEYDLIVLDTPPNRNTLAFLDAPSLMSRLFEERLIRWFVKPANRFFASGMRKGLSILESLTGAGFVGHLYEFMAALFETQANFTRNLGEIQALLQSEGVGFLFVTGPTPDTLPELRHLMDAVRTKGLHFDGLILNRTLGALPAGSGNDGTSDPGLRRALDIVAALRSREEWVAAGLRSEMGTAGLFLRLPEFSRDIHSLDDLLKVAGKLESPP